MFGQHCLNDSQYARQLQEEYDREAAANLADDFDLDSNQNGNDHNKNSPSKSKPNTLGLSPVDPSLEFLDPNPNILELFLQFNVQFFWGKLAGIEVKWSPRMTLCAGLCVYEGHGGLCSVRLSLPLLKLRPRKDLVETLLHEMIHAYLFITNNDRDHDGHGPQFQSHMHRINKSTGANISIYHNFHDEVAAYQQHWWRCDGPCQKRKPYYGFVKRAMNRAPSPRDFWWAEHQATCGGTYTKVKEPEGYGLKKGKGKEGKSKDPTSDIRLFVGKGKNDEIENGQRNKSKIVDIFSIDAGRKSDKVQTGSSGGSKSVVVNGVLMSKASSSGSSSLFSTVTKSSTAGSKVFTSSDSPRHDQMNTDRSKSPLHPKTSSLVSPDVPNANSASPPTDGWDDDGADDSWMLEAETNLTSYDSTQTNGSQDNEVIDLTFETAETDLKMPNNTKLKSLGSEVLNNLKEKYVSGKKLPHQKPKSKGKFTPGGSAKKRGIKQNNPFHGPRTKDGSNLVIGSHKFPRNFVSVCVGNESWHPPKQGQEKKNVKKYIFDELDSNDDLWGVDEGSSCTESLPNVSETSLKSARGNDSHQATVQSAVSPTLNTAKRNDISQNQHGIKRKDISQNQDGIKKNKTGTYHLPPPVVLSQKGEKSLEEDKNTKFTGQGHRLGTNEQGSSFLAQIRKTFTEKSVTTMEKYSPNLQTDKPDVHLASSSEKRSYDIAFGSQRLKDNSNNKSLKITSEKDSNTRVAAQPTQSHPVVQTNVPPQIQDFVSCPICGTQVLHNIINNHLDLCLLKS